MYLIDSNILIDFLRGKNKYALQMLRISDAGIFKIPSIVKAELLLGVEKSSDPGNNRLRVELLLLPFETLPFDDRCALHYARLRAYLEGKGMGIGANDYIIAACAMAYGATVVTNNTAEFERVPGLPVEQWAEVPLG